MDYEKEYKGALERARKLYHYDNGETTAEVAIACATIFPELEESEDERIRKGIICGMNALKEQKKVTFADIPIDEVITWLEKQGEQKSVDYENINLQPNEFAPKVEPKFHEGDWIVDKESKEVFHIEKKLINTYEIVDVEGNDYHVPNYILEEDYDIWTIQDTKDGDVLARNNDILSICIFAHFSGIHNKYSSFLCHCGLEGEGLGQELSINGYHDDCKDYVPATKEQRNLLFQKIKEAGYEWNNQKKQLDNLLLYKKN